MILADPNPFFHFNADAEPDAAPHQSDANLRPLVYRPSRPPLAFILSFHASILSIHGPLRLHFEPAFADPDSVPKTCGSRSETLVPYRYMMAYFATVPGIWTQFGIKWKGTVRYVGTLWYEGRLRQSPLPQTGTKCDLQNENHLLPV
jgi:hypothetical protein